MALFGLKSSKKDIKPINVEPISNQFKFVIPYFDVFDPRLVNYGVPVSVHGFVIYAIEDSDLFRRLNGQDVLDEAFQSKMKGILTKYIKDIVTNIPLEDNIPVIQFERMILRVSDLIHIRASKQVEQTLGVKILSLDISSINVDKDSYGYQELMSLTATLEKQNILAHHNASLNDFNLQQSLQMDQMKREQEMRLSQKEEMQRAQLENQRETMRIQREEMQRAARLQTEQTFLSAHQADLQASAASAAPPEFPIESSNEQYYIGFNGHQAGPFGMEQLRSLVNGGQMTPHTYVWTQGMANWERAINVASLSCLFNGSFPSAPPKLPSDF